MRNKKRGRPSGLPLENIVDMYIIQGRLRRRITLGTGPDLDYRGLRLYDPVGTAGGSGAFGPVYNRQVMGTLVIGVAVVFLFGHASLPRIIYR